MYNDRVLLNQSVIGSRYHDKAKLYHTKKKIKKSKH